MIFHQYWRAGLLCFAFTASEVAQNSLPAGTHSADDTSKADAHAETVAAAEDALTHQDYAKAVTLLNQALQQKPGDALALYDLGFAYDAQDREADAETAWRHAIEFNPKQFESRLGLGILLARQGAADEAREQLQAAIGLTPLAGADAAKAPAYRALARLNATRDPATASDELREAIKVTPETDSDTLLAAELAEDVGEYGDAEAAYRRLLAREANAPEATAGLAHLLIVEKKYSDADSLLTQALAAHPGDTSLTAQLAGVYAAENRVDDAVPLLEKLHQAAPADANVARMLADIYTQDGDAAKADPLYVELMATSTKTQGKPSAELLAARGLNLIKQARYAEAETVLRQSVAANASSGDAWSSLAFAASENHDPQTSLAALAQRVKYMPETPATLFLYAVSYDALKQNKSAADYYHRFLAAANGKFPDQEWQARHRLVALANMK
jgi:Flp pilus assembly protein TadD